MAHGSELAVSRDDDDGQAVVAFDWSVHDLPWFESVAAWLSEAYYAEYIAGERELDHEPGFSSGMVHRAVQVEGDSRWTMSCFHPKVNSFDLACSQLCDTRP
jgi:hypothetical protein